LPGLLQLFSPQSFLLQLLGGKSSFVRELLRFEGGGLRRSSFLGELFFEEPLLLGG